MPKRTDLESILLIGNKAEDTLSFIDVATLKEVSKTSTGRGPHEVVVTPDETIWTECSHKFTRAAVAEMLAAAGLQLREWYAAPGDMFGLSLSCRAG